MTFALRVFKKPFESMEICGVMAVSVDNSVTVGC